MSLFKSKPAATTGGTESGMVNLIKTAKVSLEKGGLAGQRAAVYLVLDRSGSMGPFYSSGAVQRLAEQALGLSANLDDDGTVPVVFFDHQVFTPVEFDLANYVGRVEKENRALGSMGGTNYSPAMRAVVDHFCASRADAPAFVIFQTDGDPSDRAATEAILKQVSNLPIFWQFVGFGNNVSYLKGLDTLRGRHVDNAGFFSAGRDPRGMTDADLYTKLLAEFPQWLTAARAAGVL